MSIKGIKYTGPILDNSGYARACRGNILALHSAGIPLTLNPISFENLRPDLGKDGEIIQSLINNPIEYNYNIIHTTPEFWSKHVENGVTNVGYTIWETTKLHPDWPKYINKFVDKVLVGCEWNVEVFKNSGVTIPIGVVPHGINKAEYDSVEKYNIAGVKDSDFMFYSIFQWTERKNPLAMIKAYYHAFSSVNDVVLVLKTYRSDYSDNEKTAIKTTIQRLKDIMPMDHYPKVVLISEMLSEQEIAAVHKRGDCYVSLDRGEGFGLSPFQAGAVGNPIIVTGFGGTTEYAKEDNSYLVDYQLTPVYGMPWCITSLSEINTLDGYKIPKELTSGTSIYSGSGKVSTITKIEERALLPIENIISLSANSLIDDIVVTDLHELFLFKNNKIIRTQVKDINIGDYLIVPIPQLSESANVVKDPNLFYLIGLYLAEGYVNIAKTNVGFGFHINESETIARTCREYMKSVFDVSESQIYFRERLDSNSCEVVINNREVANFFHSNFGTGSNAKKIPSNYKFYKDVICRKALLKGYWDGDGHISYRYKNKAKNQKRHSPECLAETVSKSLATDLRDLLLSFGICPSINVTNRNNKQVSYVISVNDVIFDTLFDIKDAHRINNKYKIKISDNLFGVMVTKKEFIEDYIDSVFSIAVAPNDELDGICDNGSYILNGVASGNSRWYKGNQCWAEPNIIHGAELMKSVYNNREEASARGKKLQSYIYDNFSWECISDKIIKELEEI